MSTLNRRAWARSALSLVAFMALLFVPAGTFHFWQGWLYGFVFVAATTAISIYFLKHDPKLVERRMKVGPAAEQRPVQKIIMAITFGGLHIADRSARLRLSLALVCGAGLARARSQRPARVELRHLFHCAQAEQLRGINDQGRGGPTGRLDWPVCNREASALLGRPAVASRRLPLRLDLIGACWWLLRWFPYFSGDCSTKSAS